MDMTPLEVQQGLQQFYSANKAGRPPRVTDVALLGSGFETDVFAFSLEVQENGSEAVQDLVLRVYAGEGSSEKAAREFAAMRRLHAAGYPVPRVLLLQHEPETLGQPFVIMERIHGVSLEKSYWAASEERRQDVQETLYGLMAALHALDGKDILPDSPLADARNPYDFIDGEISMLHDLRSRLEGREPPSLREALAWLSSRRSTVPCERLIVIHGDFHRNNVLLRPDGAAFVIDWSNVRLADFRTDLAWNRLITQLIFYGKDQPDGGEKELLLYERLAGRKVANIDYFEVAACTRLLLSVLISLQYGAARQGMRPGAEALMRRDADHTRHVATLLQERTGIPMPDLDDALSALLE